MNKGKSIKQNKLSDMIIIFCHFFFKFSPLSSAHYYVRPAFRPPILRYAKIRSDKVKHCGHCSTALAPINGNLATTKTLNQDFEHLESLPMHP